MKGSHFDPAAAHSWLSEKLTLVLILLLLSPLLVVAVPMALWKRLRGEGWRVTPWS